MSRLTEDFAAAIAEIAADLGEGLTATLVVPQTAVDPDTGAVESSGADLTYDFACPPPSPWSTRSLDGGEIGIDALRLVVPRIEDGSGNSVTPVRGNLVRLYGRDHSIVLVSPIAAGDDVAGYELAIRA